MPLYNFTIDDASPVINYIGTWIDTNTSDLAFTSYANSTFHATNETNAAITFDFNGTAIYVYGAKRHNHDEYTVVLDGHSSTSNGFSAESEFQQVLFSATDLDATLHSLSIVNTPTLPESFLDIDFVVVTIGDGDPHTPFVDATWDDTATNISYSQDWVPGVNSLNTLYYNQTFHITDKMNSVVLIPFFGDAVFLYGGTGSNHGVYTVSIDGGQVREFTGATQSVFRPQSLLFFASGLGHANHSLVLTAVNNTGLFCDLDFVTSTSWPSASSAHTHSTFSHTGTVVGGVVGGLALLALAVGLTFVFVRKTKRRRMGYAASEGEDADANKIQPFGVILEKDLIAVPETGHPMRPFAMVRGLSSGTTAVGGWSRVPFGIDRSAWATDARPSKETEGLGAPRWARARPPGSDSSSSGYIRTLDSASRSGPGFSQRHNPTPFLTMETSTIPTTTSAAWGSASFTYASEFGPSGLSLAAGWGSASPTLVSGHSQRRAEKARRMMRGSGSAS